MNVSEAELRAQLTLAMARAVEAEESYQNYFGDAHSHPEYRLAKLEGAVPDDLRFLRDYADFIAQYIVMHGVDIGDVIELSGKLFAAYQSVNAPTSSFDSEAQGKIKEAVAEALANMVKNKE